MSERLIVEGRDSQNNVVRSVLDVPVTPSGFTHGDQIRRDLIGPSGPLTDIGSIATTRDGQEFESVRVAAGSLNVKHHVTLWNSMVVGTPTAASASYTVKHTASLGKLLTLNNCRIVARSPATKVLTMYGAGGIRAYRTIFDGGTDNAFVKPEAGDYPGLGGYSAVFEECLFGRLLRSTGSHNDCVQVDSDGQADGGCLLLRCYLDSRCCPGDPLTVEADSTRGGTALIITGGGASKNVDVIDCYGDGGNITFQMQGGPGTTGTLRNARLGLDHQFSPVLTGNGVTKNNNRWAATGMTACCGQVTAGQLIT